MVFECKDNNIPVHEHRQTPVGIVTVNEGMSIHINKK